MTPDERKMLTDLADKFAQTPAPPKDSEAEDFIRTKIGSRPDALYLMTQTVLIQNLALQHAQQQIQDLQSRSGQSAGSGSFLGAQPPVRPPGYASSGYSQPAGGQAYSAPPPQYAAPYPAPPSPGSGAPSFLRGAAQTAAGVAAGALAFEGIQALFSHPGYGGGAGFGGFGGSSVGETVVNNYYDNPADSRDNFSTGVDDRDQQFADPAQLNDANSDAFDNSNLDDTSSADDANLADDGGFDNGGFDDGGDNFA